MRVAPAIALFASLFSSGCDLLVHPYAGACQPQTFQPDADGRAVEGAALAFVQNLEVGNAHAAWSEMTKEAQAATGEAALSGLASTIKSSGVTGAPTVDAAYTFQFAEPPEQFQFLPCPAPGPRNGMNFVGVGHANKQGYVVFNTASAEGSHSFFSVALLPENGVWRVLRFHFGPSTMAGRDAYEWWDLAKKQAEEGHAFQSWLLYATARTLLDRGQDYQPVGLGDLANEVAKLPTPPELQGKTPHLWSLDGQTFKILSVGTYGVGPHKALLSLVQQGAWATNADADRLNHQLIDAYTKHHPEWAEVFDEFASRTCRPDGGLCFGTVYGKGHGYLSAAQLSD